MWCKPARPTGLVVIILCSLSASLQAQDPGAVSKFEPAPAAAGDTTLGSRFGMPAANGGMPVQFATALAPTQPSPARFPTQGIIDPYAAQSSGEPGVLVPLAQSQSSVTHWMDAVEAVGSAVPLADPNFEGTVFIPDDTAFEQAYPQLALQGASGADAFAKVPPEKLAAQLNSLTVPGVVLRLSQLQPGQVLKTAAGGTLKVSKIRAVDGSLQLQQSPSGVEFSVVEPDLQSGSAIGHVINRLTPQTAAVSTEKAASGHYASPMAILQDPSQQLDEFARLVKVAGLTTALSDPDVELTLFAPNNQAMAAFLSELPAASRAALGSNQSLADELVSAHLLSGVALGTKALEALPPDKALRSQAGQVLDVHIESRVPNGLTQESAKLPLSPTAEPQISVDGSSIVSGDLTGGKSVVHILNKVLVPVDLAQQLRLPTSNNMGSTRSNSSSWSVPSSSSAVSMRSSWPFAAVAVAAVVASTFL